MPDHLGIELSVGRLSPFRTRFRLPQAGGGLQEWPRYLIRPDTPLLDSPKTEDCAFFLVSWLSRLTTDIQIH